MYPLAVLIAIGITIIICAGNLSQTKAMQTANPTYEYCNLIVSYDMTMWDGEWTYTIRYDSKRKDERHDGGDLDALNYLGSQGWELVSIPIYEQYVNEYYLKRRTK